jgi:MbtH protein
MEESDGSSTAAFLVVVNDEEQYSLWRADLVIPAGWRTAHGPAGRDECLAWVEETWTDMRPLSLRRVQRNR